MDSGKLLYIGNFYMKPRNNNLYRQVGYSIKGLLYHGTTAKSSPLNQQKRMQSPSKPPFGTTMLRFKTKSIQNLGPGFYINPEVHSSFKKISLAQCKTNKALHNKIKEPPKKYRMIQWEIYSPGVLSEKYKEKITSSFAKNMKRQLFKLNDSTLGPGSYETPKRILTSQHYRSSSVVKGSSPRFILPRTACSTPGPGQYDVTYNKQDGSTNNQIMEKPETTCKEKMRNTSNQNNNKKTLTSSVKRRGVFDHFGRSVNPSLESVFRESMQCFNEDITKKLKENVRLSIRSLFRDDGRKELFPDINS